MFFGSCLICEYVITPPPPPTHTHTKGLLHSELVSRFIIFLHLYFLYSTVFLGSFFVRDIQRDDRIIIVNRYIYNFLKKDQWNVYFLTRNIVKILVSNLWYKKLFYSFNKMIFNFPVYKIIFYVMCSILLPIKN